MQAYIIPEITTASEYYTLGLIATNESNGDLLYAVDGVLSLFEEDYPEAKEYYEANWFQNVYSNVPGDTPLEKYLNGVNGVSMDNFPKWNNILPALASSSFFVKLLKTSSSNEFSALQTTTVQYRNLVLFKSLARAVIEGIPGGLSQEENEELSQILKDNNFPSIFD
jgi:hypothetical protein